MNNLHELIITEADLKVINKYTRHNVTADEVFTFQVVLADNEIDCDGEKFDVEALRKLSELFIGQTGSCASMRIYDAYVTFDSMRTTSTNEPHAMLVGKAYMMRCHENDDLIKEIEKGTKRTISISCAVRETNCSICNNIFYQCNHKKGENYNGIICCVKLEHPTDAYEFSIGEEILC